MPTQVQYIYNDVINTVLENSGFQTLAIMSQADFFRYLVDVLQDFTSRTGCIKKIFGLVAQYGVSTYTEPDNAMDVQVVHFNNVYMDRSSGWYLDNYRPGWQASQGNPERWREDETPPKSIQFDPTPLIQGHQATPTIANPVYGQIAATATPNDFDLLGPPAGGYGTIQSGDGNLPPGPSVYLEAVNAGYGLISDMVGSNGNIDLIATGQPVAYPQFLSDYITFIPDSFTEYLKYGILEKIFSQDGEYKDNARAQWCKTRYEEGIKTVALIMTEVGVEG